MLKGPHTCPYPACSAPRGPGQGSVLGLPIFLLSSRSEGYPPLPAQTPDAAPSELKDSLSQSFLNYSSAISGGGVGVGVGLCQECTSQSPPNWPNLSPFSG